MTAVKTYRVNVTPRDIALGTCRDPQRCPVARALRRAVRARAHTIAVGAFTMTFTHGRRRRILVTPDEITQWIAAFDQHQPVQPFHFEVQV